MLSAWGVFFSLLAVSVSGGDLYELGRAAEGRARYADAAGSYAACVDAAGPLSPYARVRGAVCRAIAGDLAGGARELDTLIESAGDAPWAALAAHERALLYIRENQRAEAATLFSRAHEAPTELWWLEDIRWAAAENALSLPGHEAPAIVFFDTEARTSNWGKKRYEAAKLLSTVPADEVRLAAVIYLVNSGAANEAEPLLKSVPEFGADQAALKRLRERAAGRVDVARGRTEPGLERLWRIGVDPAAGDTGLEALLDLVNHHARLKHFDEGERAMVRLVALKPGAAQTLAAHKALASAYAREARPEDAEKHYLEAAEHTDDPREIQSALLGSANAFRQQGRAREALDRFGPLIERYPASEAGVEAAYWSGALLYEAGAERDLVLARFRSAASHGVSNYYGHRAQDLLAQLGDRDAKREKPLEITPKESILRPIRLDHDKPENALKKLDGDERIARLAFFAERGYPEAEWEALALANALKGIPDAEPFYLAMGEAGATAFTAMQLAAANHFGDNGDGSQTLARLRVRYPLAYGDLVNRYAKEVGVDPYLMLAIARQESTYRPALTSIAGAQGVMQLMPATAKWLVKDNPDIPADAAGRLTDPRASLRLGAHYLHLMLDRYEGNVVYALAAYNGGPGNCDTWRRNFKGKTFSEFIEFIPFTETRNYVKRVLANYVTYHSIYPDAN
jgi:soluble lytic murein transglycosylase-like protein